MSGPKVGPAPRSLRLSGIQTAMLARRSLVAEWRQLFSVLPGLVFPLLLAAVYTRQFQRALGLPGFPEVESFLDFILPASILQAVSFGASSAGTELALDIENGFLDRLLASPVARVPVLIGRLAGAAIVAAGKTLVIVSVFMVFGAEIAGGPAAVLVLLAVSSLLVLVIGGISQVLAIRTGSQEAVGATFPLIFVTIFMSSAFFPTNLMSGWFRVVAQNNPITWIVDPLRRLVVVGWSWTDAAAALGIPTVCAVGTVGAALVALQRKLSRP